MSESPALWAGSLVEIKACVFAGCGKQSKARGYCAAHYSQWARRGVVAEARIKAPRGACAEAGCERLVHAKGLCTSHYALQYRTGRPPAQPVPCAEVNCPNVSSSGSAHGLCPKHYQAWRRTLQPRECALEGCRETFVPTRTDRVFCKPAHARLAWNRAQRGPVETAECANCGNEFVPYHREAQEYCSSRCRQRAKYRREAPERRRKSREWARANPDLVFDMRLRRSYGITLVKWRALLASQGGKCALCGEVPGNGKWATDHDHATGQVRGILCSPCNTGIGMFRDDPARLLAAIRYIEHTGQRLFAV